MAISPEEAHRFTEIEIKQLAESEANIDNGLALGIREITIPVYFTDAMLDELETRFIYAGWNATTSRSSVKGVSGFNGERLTCCSIRFLRPRNYINPETYFVEPVREVRP